jgi:hypothetical protein
MGVFRGGAGSTEDEYVIAIVYGYFQAATVVFTVDFPAWFMAHFPLQAAGRASVGQPVEPGNDYGFRVVTFGDKLTDPLGLFLAEVVA